MPEVMTVRFIVFSVVLMLAVVLVVPTVRAYIDQSVHIHALRQQVESQEQEVDRLQGEIGRWDDPAFIQGQARDRLRFAFPDEEVWITIGGDAIRDNLDPLAQAAQTAEGSEPGGNPLAGPSTGEVMIFTGTAQVPPWYVLLRDSVILADADAIDGPGATDGVDVVGSSSVSVSPDAANGAGVTDSARATDDANATGRSDAAGNAPAADEG